MDLWRLEFQLRREGVNGFRLYAKPEMTDPDDVIDAEPEAEDLPHIHSVRKAGAIEQVIGAPSVTLSRAYRC